MPSDLGGPTIGATTLSDAALGGGSSKRIAVIGAGISGMGAAHRLAAHHNVVVFEAERRLGGHARTILAGPRKQPVDTGFLVFNNANYPNLIDLFAELGVATEPSDMSFGASIDGGWLEYGVTAPSAVFAQKRNLMRPKFLKMLRDILRFNRDALAAADDPSLTIGDLTVKMKMGAWFREYYLLPMSGAIWSTPTQDILDFPATAMMRFFDNHALLHHTGQHEWRTVTGGSVEYVTRLRTALEARGAEIRLGTPIEQVRRTNLGVEIKTHVADWEAFDEVVFATHSDDSLRLLADPSPQERAALGAVAYQPNDAVMHSDTSIMPKRRAAWASWVYTEDKARKSDRIDLTYWINRLQNIAGETQYMVTLNTQRDIRPELIHDTYTFRHPVFDKAALAAQGQVRGFNGAQNTWFCGAWMRNGFHEDGLSSGLEVADALIAQAAKAPAAA